MRHELLDRTIIWNKHQLQSLLEQYARHHNEHRPHRAPGHRPPNRSHLAAIGPAATIQRHTTCGGLINEYRPA